MYKFLDANINEWHLNDDQGKGFVSVRKHYKGTDVLVLDAVAAKELAVRLTFFAEHGRLPEEADVDWEDDEDDWEDGPFTRPDGPAAVHTVTFTNPPGVAIYGDCHIVPASSRTCEKGVRCCVTPHDELLKAMKYESDQDPDFISRASDELTNPVREMAEKMQAAGVSNMMVGHDPDMDPDNILNNVKKLYIVHASKEEPFGLYQDFIVGVFDDEDVAECERDNYLYDLEQAGHDTDLFTTSIEETTLNEISADVPKIK